MEVRAVLTHGETDMAAGPAREHQRRAEDRLGLHAQQERVACPVGVRAQRAEQKLVGQGDANAGFHKVAAPRVLRRITERATVPLQPVDPPAAIADLVASERRSGFGDPAQRAQRSDGCRAAMCGEEILDGARGAATPGNLTGWRDVVALIAGIAMRPCFGALFLLILTWQFGIGMAGVAGVLAMRIGTAIVTVTVAGVAAVVREGALASLSGQSMIRILPWFEVFAGGLITVIALSLLAQVLRKLR